MRLPLNANGIPVVLIPAWCGESLLEGERAIEPLRKFGSPIADLVNGMPTCPAVQQMVDMVAPYGLRSYWKARFLQHLPDEAIERFVEFANTATSPRSLMILEPPSRRCGPRARRGYCLSYPHGSLRFCRDRLVDRGGRGYASHRLDPQVLGSHGTLGRGNRI